jgi:glyoxylate/hydroxypyruvate reductase A
MVLKVLFTARAALWPKYRPVLLAQFAKNGVVVELMTETDRPQDIDYLIYAPATDDEDLSGFTNVKLIQSLWAGPDKLLRNPTLTQPLARMVDAGMTQGMVDYVMGHVLRHHLEVDRFSQAGAGEWLWDWAPPLAQDRTVAFLGIGALGMAWISLLCGGCRVCRGSGDGRYRGDLGAKHACH